MLAPQNMADRPGDLGRRKRRRRHLVQERLEAMVVLPVKERDRNGRAAQRLGGLEAAEACADDDDVRPLLWHGLGFRGGRC